MPTIRETCCCGATFEETGHFPQYAAREFREAHKLCRERHATPDTDVIVTTGGEVIGRVDDDWHSATAKHYGGSE